MSITSVYNAIKRIETTDPSSPLAVFRSDSPVAQDAVNTVFANTMCTQMKIRTGDINYLGTFHRDNIEEAREKLSEYRDGARAAAA